MSNVKITRSNLIMTKPKDALHKAWLLPRKMHFKRYLDITPLQKNISILLPQKNYFKIAIN